MYIDKLQDFVYSYNHSFHSSVCMVPSQVSESNEGADGGICIGLTAKWKNLEKVVQSPSSKTKFKFKVNDLV